MYVIRCHCRTHLASLTAAAVAVCQKTWLLHSPTAILQCFTPLLVTLLLLAICGSTAFDQQQKEQPQQQQHLDFHRRASAQLGQKVRQLAEAIVVLLDLENANNEAWPSLLNGTNSSLLSQLLAGQPFHPTIGVSLDAEGQAAKHGSMAFVWSPNGTGWPSVFTNGSALLAGPPRAKSNSADSKQKRTKRRIGSSGGRGSIRVSGAGGHGRGSLRLSGAAFRGSTSARAIAAGRSRFSGTSAGIGGIRPHVWLFTGGSSKGMPYEWKDDARYEYEQDSDSDVVRFEISLCFGRHKSRESCSDKVDSMLGKLAREKYEANPWHKYNDVITFALIMLGLMVASCILGLILMAIKQRNC